MHLVAVGAVWTSWRSVASTELKESGQQEKITIWSTATRIYVGVTTGQEGMQIRTARRHRDEETVRKAPQEDTAAAAAALEDEMTATVITALGTTGGTGTVITEITEITEITAIETGTGTTGDTGTEIVTVAEMTDTDAKEWPKTISKITHKQIYPPSVQPRHENI